LRLLITALLPFETDIPKESEYTFHSPAAGKTVSRKSLCVAYNETMSAGAAGSFHTAGRHHPLVKRVRAMLREGDLRHGGEVLLETPTLIEDAVTSGVEITAVLLRSNIGRAARDAVAKIPNPGSVLELDPEWFDRLSSTHHNPGIMALAKAPVWREEDVLSGAKPLVVVLAGIQDPGNCGTILRAAEAFGATGALITKGTVSPFNAKTIRAAAGTLFRLPMLTGLSTKQILMLLSREGIALLTTVAKDGVPLGQVDVTKPSAVALGSEGSGLPPELEAAGECISIPMSRQVESLNVAAAAAVTLYEIARRRLESSGYSRAVERRP
jgi:TrmH family RNA methyltransferase